MRYFDDYGNELQEREIDLTLGFLTTGTTIKVDAEPIDNIKKFAWDDEDYEEAYFYHLYPDNPAPEPTPDYVTWDELAAALTEGVNSV